MATRRDLNKAGGNGTQGAPSTSGGPDGAGGSAVDAFLAQVRATPAPAVATGKRGRLIFAMDATASRQPRWDQAQHIQADMFQATRSLGGLDVQLVFYRGFGECKASGWMSDSARLQRAMLSVRCLGGRTQIGRVLGRALSETRKEPVQAVVFVGDMVEEDPDALCDQAGQLGLFKVPLFIFHEGNDPVSASTFRQMARLSGGACCPFDDASAARLRDLLQAVAIYAAGGRRALENARTNREVAGLLEQLK